MSITQTNLNTAAPTVLPSTSTPPSDSALAAVPTSPLAPTQPIIDRPRTPVAQTQSDYIPLWPTPTPSDYQRYFEWLDEQARLREVYRQEMIKGTWWMREILWQLQEAGEPLRPVEIANRVTRRFQRQFQDYEEKVAKRLELLKLVGLMLRQGRLVRYSWNRLGWRLAR
jgi:hypothetical protein